MSAENSTFKFFFQIFTNIRKEKQRGLKKKIPFANNPQNYYEHEHQKVLEDLLLRPHKREMMKAL